MGKSKNGFKVILFALLIAALFAASAVLTAKVTKAKAEEKAAQELAEQEAEAAEAEAAAKADAEEDLKLDKYSMQQYCHDNAMAVFDALSAGDKNVLEELMIDPSGIEDVMDFADWSGADFENAVSMGSGSLTTEPDGKGRMDESERFFVEAGGTKYVFFIETRTSELGRVNDGVSAIGVTTFSHFDAVDYKWNGEKDDQSVLAGELFWNEG